jgi:predicted membrane GTPase involved in stress response
MPSTFSTDLKLELMATGENAGTWGTKTNTNLDLVQQSIAGFQEIDVASSDVTLSMSNGTLSNARNMVIKFIGTLATDRVVNFPSGIDKYFSVIDGTTHSGNSLTFKVTGQSGFKLCQGNKYICHANGTDIVKDHEEKVWRTINAAETIQSGAQLFVDTSSSAVTVTLPASPLVGDEVTFLDSKYTFDTNNLSVDRNSNKLLNNTTNLTVGVEGAAFTLVYASASVGWTYKDK